MPKYSVQTNFKGQKSLTHILQTILLNFTVLDTVYESAVWTSSCIVLESRKSWFGAKLHCNLQRSEINFFFI